MSVVFKRDGRVATLLRAVMDQSVFADVQVARSGSATPFVRPAVSQIVLEPVKPSPALLAETFQLFVNLRLSLAQGFELSGSVMNDAKRTAESQFNRAARHGHPVFRVFYPAADHRIDTHMKFGALRQIAEIAIEHLEALLRDFIRRDVVNADLQILKPGGVELFDPISGHEVAVADQPRDHPARANVRENL